MLRRQSITRFPVHVALVLAFHARGKRAAHASLVVLTAKAATCLLVPSGRNLEQKVRKRRRRSEARRLLWWEGAQQWRKAKARKTCQRKAKKHSLRQRQYLKRANQDRAELLRLSVTLGLVPQNRSRRVAVVPRPQYSASGAQRTRTFQWVILCLLDLAQRREQGRLTPYNARTPEPLTSQIWIAKKSAMLYCCAKRHFDSCVRRSASEPPPC